MATTDSRGSEAAKTLASKGAAKGGRARASVLTVEERREAARNAARARWAKAGKETPEASTTDVADDHAALIPIGDTTPASDGRLWSMFSGTLQVGDISFQCHVLNDLRRVLTQREVVRVLSGGRRSGSYLQNVPGHPPEAFADRVIPFSMPGGSPHNHGFEATLLIEICEAYLEARDAGTLHPSQANIARMAEIIMRACARVGIIALIDEATGYQEIREKRALQAKLRAFIADQMGEWVKRFPDDFWYELARLEGIRYSPRNRPLRWGKYVMAFVYDAIDPDVGQRLREINRDPAHGHNHHQWLREFGHQELNNHLQQVVAVMKLCGDMDDFRRKFARVFSKGPLQLEFSGMGWVD